MKDSLIVLGFFVGGCLLGALGYLPVDLKTGNMSIYILYALMFQIGIMPAPPNASSSLFRISL